MPAEINSFDEVDNIMMLLRFADNSVADDGFAEVVEEHPGKDLLENKVFTLRMKVVQTDGVFQLAIGKRSTMW